MNQKIKLFGTGFLQVFLVAVSTLMITTHNYTGAFIVSYLIGNVWQRNVKKAAIASEADAQVYSLGSGCGTITGMLLVETVRSLA